MVRWSRRCCAEFRPQAIVNFAAETHVDRSIDAPVAVRVDQRRRHLATVGADARVIGGSSPRPSSRRSASCTSRRTKCSGRSTAPGRATESSPYRPSSPYAASKAAADHFVRSYHRTYGLPVLLVHPSNNYGPFQFPEKLVPLVILNAARGQAAADLRRRPANARLALRRGPVPGDLRRA